MICGSRCPRIIVALEVAATLALGVAARGQCDEAARLLASDGTEGDDFGHSVFVSGTLAVVGAPEDSHGPNGGSAYVYRMIGLQWFEEAKLTSSDGAEFDQFGSAVGASDDVVIVGVPKDDDNGFNSGSAYVFRRTGQNWFEQAKFIAFDGATDDFFGHAVSIDGDLAFVGAYGDDDNGDRSGAVYAYRFDGLSWIEAGKLLASDGDGDDFFGYAVSISGDAALVGAPGAGVDGGATYVFRFDGSAWEEEAILRAPGGAAFDRFGTSVALRGNMALIGAPDDDNARGINAGSSYVFSVVGSTWWPGPTLEASDGADSDGFGVSVSIGGGALVVGAFGHDGGASNTGAAYAFSGPGWSTQDKLMPSDGAAGDWFGRAVSSSGAIAVAGVWQDPGNGNRGKAYAFDLGAARTETICPDQAGDYLRRLGGDVTGDALDLCASDDVRLQVLQSARFSLLLPFVRLEYWAYSQFAGATINSIEYAVECHVSAFVAGEQNPDTLRTYIMNYDSGQFELIDQRGTDFATDEIVEHVQLLAPSRFIDEADGEVRVRQEVFEPGSVISPNWYLKVDRYEAVVSG